MKVINGLIGMKLEHSERYKIRWVGWDHHLFSVGHCVIQRGLAIREMRRWSGGIGNLESRRPVLSL